MKFQKNLLLVVCAWFPIHVDAFIWLPTPQAPRTTTTKYIAPPEDTVIECGNMLRSTFFNNALFSGVGRTFLVYSNTAQTGSHQHSSRCEARFLTEDWPVVFTVTLQQFDVEFQELCRFDSLCIDGISYCGSRNEMIQYRYIVPANNSFTLLFTTDDTVLTAGFTVNVTTRSATCNDSVLEPTGVTSAPSQDSITQFEYEDLYTLNDYRDSCNTDAASQNTIYDYCLSSTTSKYDYPSWNYDSNRLSEKFKYLLQSSTSYVTDAIRLLTYNLNEFINNLIG